MNISLSESPLCACGCGQPTKRYNQTKPQRGIFKGQHAKYVHGHNSRGASNPNWSGGRAINGAGYVLVRISQGVYEYEHRLVMEKQLGRALDAEEVVHHIDGDHQHNAISNLMLFASHAEHVAFEIAQRGWIVNQYGKWPLRNAEYLLV